MTPRARPLRRAGFLLFEAMVAISIFVLAMVALGRCIGNCLRAETTMWEEEQAGRTLANRMAEIENEAVQVTDANPVEELKGPLERMRLRQTRTPLDWKNEKDEVIGGLFQIDLQLTWRSQGQERDRALRFYVNPQLR